eukprot:CAMPEP_0170132504 /NCGR_PEP_ID=MMETSP0033_2-20121228/435_1 /TAXON_ID=195969 /ORGANISM="Dolichomastix tenuilepis, Strain CCMP3274" /LENGTH=294 /DNA_ID=CAMNT_0010367885 /DNA_START=6 /DNA_END=890 /DNA_ORIENTATION=+
MRSATRGLMNAARRVCQSPALARANPAPAATRALSAGARVPPSARAFLAEANPFRTALAQSQHQQRMRWLCTAERAEEESTEEEVSAEGGEEAAVAAPAEEAAPAASVRRSSQPEANVFCGNLPLELDNAGVMSLFAEHDIIHANVVIHPRSGMSRGFAFLTFQSDAAADAVVAAMSGTMVQGRIITVQRRQLRPPGPRETRSRDDDNRRLYVGNLAYELESQDLHELLGEYGQVERAHVMTFHDTGRSRGFGFVTMMTAGEASAAAQNLNNMYVNGRYLRVNLAIEGKKSFDD